MADLSAYDATIEAAAREWGHDPNMLRALLMQENPKGEPGAVSPKGAFGLGQIMPDTAKGLGMTDPKDPTQQIFGAAKYLAEGRDKEGTHEGALLYYHGGPGWRSKYGPESQGYVPGVAGHYTALTKKGASVDGPAVPSDDEFLKQAAPAQPASAGAVPSDDEFLKQTGAAPAPDKPAAAGRGGIARNAAAGVLDAAGSAINVASDPAGNLVGKPLATAAVFAHDALAPYLGYERFPADVRNMLLGDNVPQPGTRLADAAGAGNVSSDTTAERLVRKGVGGAGAAAALGPGNPLLMSLVGGSGAVSGDIAASYVPDWAKPAAELGGNILGGAAALPAGGLAKGLLPGGPEYNARLAYWKDRIPADRSAPGAGALTDDIPMMTVRPGEAPAGPASIPGAVGADITTAPIPAKTPAQRIADLEKSVQQTAEERAGPQLRDATPYVEGIPPRVRASSEFTPANALDHKVAIAADPAYRAEVEATTRERNNGMVDVLRNDALDGNALERAHEYRDEVKPGPLGVFDEQKPVDASGLVDTVNGLLRGQEGKQAAVRNTLKSVLESLHDQDGNIETLPSMLYGARKNLTDLLKKGVKGVGDMADDVRASKPILMGLLPDFDKTISEGAPKFSTEYLPQFHERSLPIDQMEFLQKYQTGAKKITDGDGYLQPNKVQKMLDDILQGLKAPGVNAAKSLTDQQIQAIVNVRNELFADKLRDRMASVRGSDSFQQINRAITPTDTPVKAAAKGAAVWGAHGAMMASPAAGWGNALLGGYQAIVRPAVKAAQERKAAAAIAARKNYLLTPLPPENP